MSFEIPGRPARAAIVVIALILAIVACSREHSAGGPSTIALVTDPAALDNALARCNQSSASIESQECRSVRAALARLADERRKTDSDQLRRAQAEAEIKFEEQREALRRRHDEERARKERETNKTIDPYSLPFVPPQTPVDAQPQPAAPPVQPTNDPVVQAKNDDIVAATVAEPTNLQ
jgi:hypothetical protein